MHALSDAFTCCMPHAMGDALKFNKHWWALVSCMLHALEDTQLREELHTWLSRHAPCACGTQGSA
eukprot:1162020-Pelagomonas_calceolata.AAC.1